MEDEPLSRVENGEVGNAKEKVSIMLVEDVLLERMVTCAHVRKDFDDLIWTSGTSLQEW